MTLFALLFTLTVSAEPMFSKTNIFSLKTGTSRSGKLKGLTKKQKKKKWQFTSSDKTVAAVTRKGKYGYRITADSKKEGCAVIRAARGKAAVYLLVRVGSGTAAPNAATKAWAKGRFKLPKSKRERKLEETGYEDVIKGLPDSITLAYNEEKTYKFQAGCRDIYSDGSKGKLYDGSDWITCTVTNEDYISAYVTTDHDTNAELVIRDHTASGQGWLNPGGGSTYDLPQQGTITVSIGDASKTIQVTVTDWGIPDKELKEKWYKDVIHLSGADKINSSNIVEHYNSWEGNGTVTYPLDENGNIDYAHPQTICYGDRYQWSVDYARARLIANFFRQQFKYTMSYIGTNGKAEINWHHAKKHNIPYIGYSCYANMEFEDVCRYIGIDAEALSTWTIAEREDIPEGLRGYAAQFNRSGMSHVLTVIRYGSGGLELMDATPRRGSGTTGEPIEEFLARIASLPQ